MLPRFNEEKATELAAIFLRQAGGSMPYLKLLKLLYLADRMAFDRYGSPITFDSYVSMKNGPVLSNTYNIIKNSPDFVSEELGETWRMHIETSGRDVRLISDVVPGLSEADEQIAADVFAEHGDKDQWRLVDETHRFAEWRDPGKSAASIEYEDIFSALGKSPEESAEILSRLRAKAFIESHACKK